MPVTLDDVSLKRGDFSISGLSVSIKPGLTVITGRSGSGKTTLLTLLSGLVSPDSGSVSLNGLKTGIVFQFPERQLFAETVIKDVMYSLPHSLSEEEAEERAGKALLTAGLEREKWNLSPFSLSGGERRKAAVAGIIVSDPDVLLMDEPSVGLDAAGYESLFALISGFRKSGKTVVVVSHDEDLMLISDRLIVMENGRITGDGSFSDYIQSPVSRVSERLGLGLIEDEEALSDAIAEMLG